MPLHGVRWMITRLLSLISVSEAETEVTLRLSVWRCSTCIYLRLCLSWIHSLSRCLSGWCPLEMCHVMWLWQGCRVCGVCVWGGVMKEKSVKIIVSTANGIFSCAQMGSPSGMWLPQVTSCHLLCFINTLIIAFVITLFFMPHHSSLKPP